VALDVFKEQLPEEFTKQQDEYAAVRKELLGEDSEGEEEEEEGSQEEEEEEEEEENEEGEESVLVCVPA
jgi:hypothetical protein